MLFRMVNVNKEWNADDVHVCRRRICHRIGRTYSGIIHTVSSFDYALDVALMNGALGIIGT